MMSRDLSLYPGDASGTGQLQEISQVAGLRLSHWTPTRRAVITMGSNWQMGM